MNCLCICSVKLAIFKYISDPLPQQMLPNNVHMYPLHLLLCREDHVSCCELIYSCARCSLKVKQQIFYWSILVTLSDSPHKQSWQEKLLCVVHLTLLTASHAIYNQISLIRYCVHINICFCTLVKPLNIKIKGLKKCIDQIS